jgi:hypothetical protein
LLITRHLSLPSGIIVFYVILLKTIFQLTGKAFYFYKKIKLASIYFNHILLCLNELGSFCE